MQKKTTLLLTLLVTSAMASPLTSCGNRGDSSGSGGTVSSVDLEEEYVVKFNNNFDGTVIKVTVQGGKTVALPEDPTRPGYIFGGWYMDYRDNTTDKFDPNTPITADITVYAKWVQNISEHVVVFHFQDRVTSDSTVLVDDGDLLELPADPEYPDGTMAFTGWYTDVNCTVPYNKDAPVKGDLDLYAGWRVSKATVTFNYNYTGAPDSTSVVVDLDAPMDEPTEPTRAHYAFIGWFDRALGGTKFDFSKPVTSDMTLYAQWEENEFLVTFEANGGTLAQGAANSGYVVKGTSAETLAATVANDLVFAGHDFVGWYDEALDTDVESISATSADLSDIQGRRTVYAGWVLATYTVTFDLNYVGATGTPAAQKVKYGKTAAQPTDPVRDGFIFNGWYLDAAGTTAFTFDMTITADTTLYALWIDENAPHDPVTVTYYVDGSVYDTKTVEFNKAASTNMPTDPTKDLAIFGGWYSDPSFTTKFNANAKLIKNAVAYGKFLVRQTFEAEATNLEGKIGMGTSTNSFEESMLFDYGWVRDGTPETVSNGWFIRELYYNGATLDFEIESDKDVDDAVMYLRVSSEHDRFVSHPVVNNVEYNYLSKDEFKIVVNGEYDNDGRPVTWLDYPGLYMPMANLVAVEDLSDDKTPFEDCFISSQISLSKGTNFITLMVDNYNSHGGTFQAEAPMVDCMYLYSDATLSMFDWEYYTRPNVNVKG